MFGKSPSFSVRKTLSCYSCDPCHYFVKMFVFFFLQDENKDSFVLKNCRQHLSHPFKDIKSAYKTVLVRNIYPALGLIHEICIIYSLRNIIKNYSNW